MSLNKDLLLYLVTDRFWAGEVSLELQVKRAIESGVSFLQLREKDMEYEEFLERAIEMKEIAHKYGVPFVINDEVNVAQACGCEGVHIGQDDMSVKEARKKIGNGKILGVSVSTVEEAVEAQNQGADYLGVGAMFTTDTKKDAKTVEVNTLKEICEAVSIPVVAIGGIKKDNIKELGGSGISGIAVVSAILAHEDIEGATTVLKEECERYF